MRSATSTSPNWLLAAMVASGSWLGLESRLTHLDARTPGAAGVGFIALAPANGWAARSMAPIRDAGCAAGLMLLLIWGLRALAAGGGEPAVDFLSFSRPLTCDARRVAWLRLLRRGGRYGP